MTSERRRSTLRRLALTAAGVCAAAALVWSPAFNSGIDGKPGPERCAGSSACPPAGGSSSGTSTRSAPLGAYLDYGPRGVKLMKGFSRWLGGSEVTVGHTYLPGDLWSNIEGRRDFLDSWARWRRAKDDRIFVLNVPLMERNEEGLPDAEVKRLLRRAADGEFDRHFRVLAEHLVELGAPDTILVLGWEMNGITYTHRCGPAPEDWKEYWRRIVTTMRSVPGQKFRFDFAPSRGRDAVPWPECYPGDDVVDIIGTDSYDQPHGITFDEQVSEPYGLQFQVDFAKAHGKPISYPEWGLFRNGDNATYMLRMLAWLDEHKPLYSTISDYCPHGVWLCSTNPRAAAIYRAALTGQYAPRPMPEPAPKPTAPSASTRPPHCPCEGTKAPDPAGTTPPPSSPSDTSAPSAPAASPGH
jgi:hypothetical protein